MARSKRQPTIDPVRQDFYSLCQERGAVWMVATLRRFDNVSLANLSTENMIMVLAEHVELAEQVDLAAATASEIIVPPGIDPVLAALNGTEPAALAAA